MKDKHDYYKHECDNEIHGCYNNHDHHEHEHDHCHECHPVRHQSTHCGKADTTKIGDCYDSHACAPLPNCGYQVPLCKPYQGKYTPQQQVEYLTGRVDELICMFNKYDCKVWGAYDELVCSTLYNEAYYHEVRQEEGYLAETDAKYSITHIPYLDCCGKPIFMELGLAYNNTTNSGVKEDMFTASERKLADKLIPACNIGDYWSGLVTWNCAPIPSSNITPPVSQIDTIYTFAVTKDGYFKFYPNNTSQVTLQHDKVVNSMGCQGVLIAGGEFTPDKYPSNKDITMSRTAMGMNFSTKERFIVTVNGTMTTGCTSQQLADIFKKYGCTIACEIMNGNGSSELDKGEFIFMPAPATDLTPPTIPEVNAFWYITKERHYCNEYVRDVATLTQRIGQNNWKANYNSAGIGFLAEALEKEILDRSNADTDINTRIDDEAINRLNADADLNSRLIQEISDRVNGDDLLRQAIADSNDNFIALLLQETTDRTNADDALDVRIDNEATNRSNADTVLQTNIYTETTNRIASDNALDTRIDNEIVDRTDSDTALQSNINTETTNRISSDNALGLRIVGEIVDRTNADIDLQNNINSEHQFNVNEHSDLQSDINSNTVLINSLQAQVDNVRTDLTILGNTVSSNYSTLLTLINSNTDDINAMQALLDQLQTEMASLDLTMSQLSTTVSVVETTLNNIKQQIIDINTRLSTNEADIVNIKTDISSIEASLLDVQNQIISIESAIADIESGNPVMSITVANNVMTVTMKNGTSTNFDVVTKAVSVINYQDGDLISTYTDGTESSIYIESDLSTGVIYDEINFTTRYENFLVKTWGTFTGEVPLYKVMVRRDPDNGDKVDYIEFYDTTGQKIFDVYNTGTENVVNSVIYEKGVLKVGYTNENPPALFNVEQELSGYFVSFNYADSHYSPLSLTIDNPLE